MLEFSAEPRRNPVPKTMNKEPTIIFKLTSKEAAVVDKIREETGATRTSCVRAIIAKFLKNHVKST